MPFFYGWWIVIACASVVLFGGGTFFYSFSALVRPLEDEFGWKRALIAAGFSIRTWMGGMSAPVVGYLADRLGPRRVLIAGVFLVGSGFLLFSQTRSVWTFFAAVIVIALGMSACGPAVTQTAVAHWFTKKVGRAMAIMSVGTGISGFMAVVTVTLISAFGWRTALVILGVILWAICFPMALTVRNRPQDMGLLPDGERLAPSDDPPSGQKDPALQTDGLAAITVESVAEGLTVRQALRTRAFWLLAIAITLLQMGSLGVIAHGIAFLQDEVGFSGQGAALAAMGLPIASLPGRLAFGWLADYVDKRWVLAATCFLQGLGILAFANIYSFWQAAMFLMIFSPAWGGYIAVRPALQADYFGVRAFGAIQGLLFFIGTIGGVIGPVFAGAVYDAGRSYRPAFLLLGVIAMAGAAGLAMLKRPWQRTAEVSSASSA
ncbi:MAG: MFS transporter [Dehalococcoidia bacterium]